MRKSMALNAAVPFLFGAFCLICAPALADDDVEKLVRLLDVPAGGVTRLPNQPNHVLVWYSPKLDPARFRAILNGIDVSDRFEPKPNHSERVDLPFSDGENSLVIEAGAKKDSATVVAAATDKTVQAAYSINYENLDAQPLASTNVRRNLSKEQVDAFLLQHGAKTEKKPGK